VARGNQTGMATRESTDTGIGLTLLFGVLALGAAAYTYLAASQTATAWGFAAAVALGCAAVAAPHVYGQ